MANSRQRRASRRALTVMPPSISYSAPVLPKRKLDRFRWFKWLRERPRLSGGGGIGLAFAAVLKGIDWQINGAVKSAVFAFLIAWAILAFAIYISSMWDKRRPFVSMVWVLAGVLMWVIWWAYLPPPPKTPVSAAEVIRPQIVMPITATFRGLLVPGNETTPKNACSNDKFESGSLIVMFGDQAVVLRPSEQRSSIIRISGEDVLSFTRRNGEISLDATIRRETGEVVARVERNEFRLLSNEDYYMERPDAYTLMVISPDKAPVLYVKYLNRSALEFRGIFHYPNRQPLNVQANIEIPENGMLYVENCWATDGPIINRP